MASFILSVCVTTTASIKSIHLYKQHGKMEEENSSACIIIITITIVGLHLTQLNFPLFLMGSSQKEKQTERCHSDNDDFAC